MKSTALTIVIPTEIMSLPDVSLPEKIALATIADSPGCSNARLAKLLGNTERGIEAMLKRLRGRELIQPVGRGRARTHRLLFPVESHTQCGKNESSEHQAESHKKCAEPPLPAYDPLRPELPVSEFVAEKHVLAESCIHFRDVESALIHYHEARMRVDLEPDLPDEARDKLVAIITAEETRTLAFGLGFRLAEVKNLSQAKKRILYQQIWELSREKLAEIRPGLEQARVGNSLDILALPGY